MKTNFMVGREVLVNRDFKLPEDGWYQLIPKGEYPHASGVVQVVDDAALQAICNRFAQEARGENFPGILVDFDHFSDDPDKATEAAGWITAMEHRLVRGIVMENGRPMGLTGIWGKVRWSDSGEAAVKGGRYRLVSPVWRVADCEKIGNGRVRPLRLDRVALTNDPNMKGMEPLSNRSETGKRGDGETEIDEFSPAVGAAEADGKVKNQNQRKTMKSVAMKLGLSAEASEDAVLAAVTQVMNRAETAEAAVLPLKNRATALETENKALLDAQVEVDLAKYANRIKPESKEAWKKNLIANRASAIELLEGLPEPTASTGKTDTAKVLNRAATQAPADQGKKSPDSERIKNRALEIQAAAPGLGWDVAWKRAEQENASNQ